MGLNVSKYINIHSIWKYIYKPYNPEYPRKKIVNRKAEELYRDGNTIYLYCSIHKGAQLEFAKLLNEIVKEELAKKEELSVKGEIYTPRANLKIYSCGGIACSGSTIASMIEACAIDIHGIVEGNCQSAAIPILLACKTRKAIRGSSFLVHYTYERIKLYYNQLKKYYTFTNEFESIWKNYILSKTKLSNEMYDSLCEADVCFYTDSALTYGIIEEVI